MRMWLAVHFKRPRAMRRLAAKQRARVVELAAVFLPPAFRRATPEIIETPTGFLCQWQSPESLVAKPLALIGSRALAISGHTTIPDLATSEAVLKATRIEGSSVTLSKAPGGMASFGLMHDQGLDAWSGNPAVESVFVAESDDLVCAGSRPLAVHLVATDALRPTTSVDYLLRGLIRGFTASELSPYAGTRFLPPRQRLCVRGKQLSYVELPATDDEPDTPTSTEEAIELMLPELQAATRALPTDRPTELWLSGGKDSRLLAALLVDQDRQAVANTMAPEGHGEEQVARQIAELCGFKYNLNSSVSGICTTGIRHRVRTHLRDTDALVCEAHLTIWPPFAELGMSPKIRPFLLGHAHHLRGGYARKMRYDDFALRLRDCFVEPRDLLSTSAQELGDKIARHYRQRTDVPHAIRWLYWAYNDYRAGRWLPSWYIGAATYRPVHYPLCDERVVRVASKTDSFSLISERLQFGLIAKLSTPLSRLPLFENRWRFEAQKASDVDPDGYGAREPVMVGHSPSAGAVPWLALGESGLGQVMTAEIRASAFWSSAREFLADEMTTWIDDPTGKPITTPMAKMLWRVYCAAVIFDGDWL